jgi:hypothetical protein
METNRKIFINTGDINHTTIKIPDFILLRECKKENQKLKNELIVRDAYNAKLYNQLEDAYSKIEKQDKIIDGYIKADTTEIKEELLALKREEHYIRQKEENKTLQLRLNELRKLVDKTVWKELKSNNI